MQVYKGFTVYKNGYGPVWVVLHSGPAISGSSRDDNSDIIASICFERLGGTIVLSNLTRNLLSGIDFNRDVPPLDKAIGMYHKFAEKMLTREIKEYKSKYAFVASNEKDYNERLKLYKTMWSHIRNSGDFFIFLHRQFARLKNYPSVMDLITFDSCGIKAEILKKIVENVNAANEEFFTSIERDFKNVTYIEEMRSILNDPSNEMLKNDMKIIEKYDKISFEKLSKEFTKKNFLAACRGVIEKMPKPLITLEKVFSAKSAIAPKKEIIKSGKRIAIEVEVNSFMGGWYPEKAAEIILDIVGRIKEVAEYKRLGFTQTQILKFISSVS
ncbi:MAG: hypothetical protein QXQ40_01755 [Candidatus Aenigmatarchaeota archaeon]